MIVVCVFVAMLPSGGGGGGGEGGIDSLAL